MSLYRNCFQLGIREHMRRLVSPLASPQLIHLVYMAFAFCPPNSTCFLPKSVLKLSLRLVDEDCIFPHSHLSIGGCRNPWTYGGKFTPNRKALTNALHLQNKSKKIMSHKF